MDLYTEIILDYYKNPRQKEEMADADTLAAEYNATCGDKITVFLKINKEGMVEKASYIGEGCAISQAATSMLMEKITNMSIKDVEKITNEEIFDMLGVEISAGRVKCSLLGLAGIRNAIKNYQRHE